MRKVENRKLALVAIMPAITIPIQHGLRAYHAPDYVAGFFIGLTIIAMIAFLMMVIREKNCNFIGSKGG